jgi:hypothetical protein
MHLCGTDDGRRKSLLATLLQIKNAGPLLLQLLAGSAADSALSTAIVFSSLLFATKYAIHQGKDVMCALHTIMCWPTLVHSLQYVLAQYHA